MSLITHARYASTLASSRPMSFDDLKIFIGIKKISIGFIESIGGYPPNSIYAGSDQSNYKSSLSNFYSRQSKNVD
jgi:hypothetical protein